MNNLVIVTAFLALSLGTGYCLAAQISKDPEQLIGAFANADNADAIFYAMNRLGKSDPSGLRKAALAHLTEADAKTRYAAMYALALSAGPADADEVARFLRSPIVDERLLAAATLLAIQDKRGLPVLIGALGERTILAYREPGETAAAFARTQLLWFTNEDFGLQAARSAEDISGTQSAWQQWWERSGAAVHFDAARRRFIP